MSSLMQSLGIDKLSAEEKIALVDEIYESIEQEVPPISDALRRELERRLEHLRSNPNDHSSWEDVQVRLGMKDPLLSDAQRKELDRRIKAYESNPRNVISRDDAKVKLGIS